jgi:hypothetical protein
MENNTMDSSPNGPKRKWSVFKTVVVSGCIILLISGFFIYRNFNRLLSNALLNTFNSSVISDVYELKFENLRVKPLEGSIRVYNVSWVPREKPLKNYPYINSSFSLHAENFLLENVEIRTLLKENRLILKKVHIIKPEIELNLNGERHIILPYAEKKAEDEKVKGKKRPIESFILSEFVLKEASLHSVNSEKKRHFSIGDINISFSDLHLLSDSLKYQLDVSKAGLTIGSITGDLQYGPIKHISFSNFKIGIDSLEFKYSLDTMIYRFYDFNTAMKGLDIQTSDSTYQVMMNSFDLSYQDRSIEVKEVSFKPNVSQAVLQRAYQYQHTEFSGSVGSVKFAEVNFDSLFYEEKLFIDEIVLENVKAFLYKDRTKPMDAEKYPEYLGQTIMGISNSLHIRKISATEVQLKNTERKPDKTEASVLISKGSLSVENITNLYPKEKLTISAEAYLMDNVKFNALVSFRYDKPQFSFESQLGKFNLPDLNGLIGAYTPAKINNGIADEISFSGIAEEKTASGTMKFLYHDLEIDLNLEDQAKWKSSLVALAANTVLNNSNPSSEKLPPRIVQFSVERDMNKAFVNLLVKSILDGMKETMIMSKKNRRTFREAKREVRKEKKE